MTANGGHTRRLAQIWLLAFVVAVAFATPVGAATPQASAAAPTPIDLDQSGNPGDPIQLNHELAPGEEPRLDWLTPDGSRAIYKAPPEAFYSVPVEGGTPVRLTPDLPPDGYYWGTGISPDSSYFLFIADVDGLAHELFAVPIDGGPVHQISDGTPQHGVVEYFRITDDMETVVYWVDETGDRDMVLYSGPFTGGPATRLFPANPGLDYFNYVALAPDMGTVVFDSSNIGLASVPIDGGPVANLSADVGGGSSQRPIITADSEYVFFMDGDEQLQRAPIGGGSLLTLSNSPVMRFGLTSDSERIVWLEEDGLRSAPISGAPIADLGEAESFAITPDSAAIVYLTRAPNKELRIVDVAGGDSELLAPIPDDETMWQIQLTAQYVAYVIDGTTLYSAPLDGSGAEILATASSMDQFAIAPDGKRVVYNVDQGASGYDLHSVAIGGGTPTLLSSANVDQGAAEEFQINADSRYVVYSSGPANTSVWSVLIGWRCHGGFATIIGTSSADVITGTSGDDVIVSFGGADEIRAYGGNDAICAGRGDDAIFGGDGDDTINGGGGADMVRGGTGDDEITGGPGHDDLHGLGGDDTLFGNSGNDTLRGYRGTDTLSGGPGNDVLRGDRDADVLSGRSGDDSLYGNAGNDELDGGQGTDVANGGTGNDTCLNNETETSCEISPNTTNAVAILPEEVETKSR